MYHYVFCINCNRIFHLKATSRLNIGEVIVRRLLYNLVNEAPAETWFDEVASVVISKIEVVSSYVVKIEIYLLTNRWVFGLER